ncbi:MAG: hypothetical protein [Olavius algarvensis Gamma 3 endosymbiont]|nr:MAG: hypothetical protein [Olavius algarvensis Gamma 3 endosymbiont]
MQAHAIYEWGKPLSGKGILEHDALLSKLKIANVSAKETHQESAG